MLKDEELAHVSYQYWPIVKIILIFWPQTRHQAYTKTPPCQRHLKQALVSGR